MSLSSPFGFGFVRYTIKRRDRALAGLLHLHAVGLVGVAHVDCDLQEVGQAWETR